MVVETLPKTATEDNMKFSPDTSRLVEGRWYWYLPAESRYPPARVLFDRADRDLAGTWGDECPPPTVDVEPERPEPALLPCPFCGVAVDPRILSVSDGYYVRCVTCRADGPMSETSADAAAAAWNTRSAPPVPAPCPFCTPGFEYLQCRPCCTPAAKPAPAEPARPAWVPPVCPAGQVFLDPTGDLVVSWYDRPLEGRCRYPKPAWPPRIGEIVEVLPGRMSDYDDVSAVAFVPAAVLTAPCEYGGGEGVQTAFGIMWRKEEGLAWRWVYRDLSDYTPPGGVS